MKDDDDPAGLKYIYIRILTNTTQKNLTRTALAVRNGLYMDLLRWLGLYHSIFRILYYHLALHSDLNTLHLPVLYLPFAHLVFLRSTGCTHTVVIS